MSTPYQKIKPHFPDLTRQETEALIGDTWDFYCQRDMDDAAATLSACLVGLAGTPLCLFWSEEEWLQQISRMQEGWKVQEGQP